jgi:hypothetical protein
MVVLSEVSGVVDLQTTKEAVILFWATTGNQQTHFYQRSGGTHEPVKQLITMNHHDGESNEAGRWEELQEPQDRSGIIPPLEAGTREHHQIEEVPRFGGPPSHLDRQVSGAPSLVASDVSSAEDSKNNWRSNLSDCSFSSDRKIPSMPEYSRSQMPPPPPPPPPPLRPSQSSIEISPGVQVRLRGADETWKAIEYDYYMPAECICCESTIFCIQDADYVLCPDCRVVSRLEGSSSRGMGGVGLGFKYEDLARWQDDILRARREKAQRQIEESVPPRGEWS